MTQAPLRNLSPNPAFDWKRWPETEQFVDQLITSGLSSHAFAAQMAERMRVETSTRFQDWVDHLVVTGPDSLPTRLIELGFEREAEPYEHSVPVFAHRGGMFPRIAVQPERARLPETRVMAIKVESIADFSRATNQGLEVRGDPLSPYRVGRISGEGVHLDIVERAAYRGFDCYPGALARQGRMRPQAARDTLAARDLWRGRKRRFEEDAEGFDATDALLDRVIETAGSPDLACHLIFEVERDYWQGRNRAARVQKQRQDRLGLGWANHDHHTFRCSRQFFPRTIGMFERLGFHLRERYHAGEHAGWGAQILEHPTTGIVIFADLDLAPEEATHDFAHSALPNLDRPNTVGLWVALHGESMLDAGMHHLEAQFDFDALKEALKSEAGIEVMAPFSNFPFLRQAFTAGERWPVNPQRADRCLKQGWISADQHAKFLADGALGSHLENLQRRDGYKGFNQQSVSAIIAATDPRLH